jgi:tRNA-specific adenosine deaminase 3
MANYVRCRALDAAFPRDHSLSHLRRFAKADMLPDHLKPAALRKQSQQTIYVLIFPPVPDISELRSILAPFVPAPVAEKRPGGGYDDDDDDHETESLITCTAEDGDFPILTTRVPLQTPLSPQQAARWSQTMWPVMYNPAAPRAMIAPPPQILSQTYESIRPRAGLYLSLAYKVAEEAKRLGRGRGVGVVVVDPRIDTGDHHNNNWERSVVAVAGDARYCAPGVPPELLAEQHASSVSELASRGYNPDLEGGPELHAIMRAAALIASRRLVDDYEDAPATLSGSSSSSDRRPVYNPPLSPLESHFLYPPPEKEKEDSTTTCFEEEEEEEEGSGSSPRILPRSQGGYLCTDLDIYITHEPCVSCSMGMLLSRFRAVIFPRRGRMSTGGLASEPIISTPDDDDDDDDDDDNTSADSGEKRERERERERNYYGLHWRKELNWRALCFEFVEDEPQQEKEEVVDFYA